MTKPLPRTQHVCENDRCAKTFTPVRHGSRYCCAKCRNAHYRRVYRADGREDREAKRRSNRRSWQKHRERLLPLRKEQYRLDPRRRSRAVEYAKKWNRSNREKRSKTVKRYYARNKEKILFYLNHTPTRKSYKLEWRRLSIEQLRASYVRGELKRGWRIFEVPQALIRIQRARLLTHRILREPDRKEVIAINALIGQLKEEARGHIRR